MNPTPAGPDHEHVEREGGKQRPWRPEHHRVDVDMNVASTSRRFVANRRPSTIDGDARADRPGRRRDRRDHQQGHDRRRERRRRRSGRRRRARRREDDPAQRGPMTEAPLKTSWLRPIGGRQPLERDESRDRRGPSGLVDRPEARPRRRRRRRSPRSDGAGVNEITASARLHGARPSCVTSRTAGGRPRRRRAATEREDQDRDELDERERADAEDVAGQDVDLVRQDDER